MRRGCWLRGLIGISIVVLAPAVSGCATALGTLIGSSFVSASPPRGLASVATAKVGSPLRVVLNDGRILRAHYRGLDSLTTPGDWSLRVRLMEPGPRLTSLGHRDSVLSADDIRDVRSISRHRGKTIGFCAGLTIDVTLITLAMRFGDRIELLE